MAGFKVLLERSLLSNKRRFTALALPHEAAIETTRKFTVMSKTQFCRLAEAQKGTSSAFPWAKAARVPPETEIIAR